MRKLLGLLCVSALSVPAFAVIDISTEIATFQTNAEGYAEAAIPAVFVIIAIYFLIRLIKRFTR